MKGDGDRLLDVYRALDRMHAWRGWHWWPEADPFEVIVGAILVQNTAWTNVERALDNLRAVGSLDPGVMAHLDPEELEALVRPSGQYRQKARKLQALLRTVMEAGSLEGLLGRPPSELRTRLLGTWWHRRGNGRLHRPLRRPSAVVRHRRLHATPLRPTRHRPSRCVLRAVERRHGCSLERVS